MFLNTITYAEGSKQKRKRVGRGIGCTLGKTCGRGHKGQHARSGGFHKVGFEGGQMPLQRRLPKVGFKSSIKRLTGQVNLSEINSLTLDEIDINALKTANIIAASCIKVRVIDSGKIERPVTLKGLYVTSGAATKIINLGGKVEV